MARKTCELVTVKAGFEVTFGKESDLVGERAASLDLGRCQGRRGSLIRRRVYGRGTG